MGMRARIYAIGPFSKEVENDLMYSSEAYKNTKEGVNVFVYGMFDCCTSSQSKILADCFGIDPYDFNQHEFTPPTNTNWQTLKEEFDEYSVEQTQLLANNGFKFYFVPDY